MIDFYLSMIMFVISFVVVVLVLMVFNKAKKYKASAEVTYLINKYNLDTKKISVKKLLRDTTFVDAFIISLIVAIVVNIKSLVLEMIVGFALIFVFIFICYGILGKYYINKGYSKKKEGK